MYVQETGYLLRKERSESHKTVFSRKEVDEQIYGLIIRVEKRNTYV